MSSASASPNGSAPTSAPRVVLAMHPAVLPRLLDDRLLDRLAAVSTIDAGLVLDEFTTPAAVRALESAEVLLTCWGCPSVDESVLEKAPKLGAIVHGAGTVKGFLDPECWRRGLRVSSAAAANAVPVAEFTVAMIVLANKYALPLAAAFRADPTRRDWTSTYPDLGGYRKTVGLVGASRVGRKVIELLAAYDLDVMLSDPTIDAADAARLGVRLVDLETLLASADVVSVHAPDIPATRNLLDAGRLRLIRDGATLINTARGRIIDTDALTAELVTGRFHAVLDVTHPEPLPAGHPLFDLPNVLLTPHIAGSLGNEILRMGEHAVSEVERYAAGLEFAHPVLEAQLDILA